MSVWGKRQGRKVLFFAVFLIILTCMISPVWGLPISLNIIEQNYNQTFTSSALANTGTGTPPTASSLPPGWAMNKSSYIVGDGAIVTGGIRSYGPSGQEDRALGSLSNDVGTLIYGAEFINNTGVVITSLDIQYVGEQWRRGQNANPDTLFFEFSLNATSLTDAGPGVVWTGISALNFVSPITGSAAGVKLNGNLLANRQLKQDAIDNLYIPQGSLFWIRFLDYDIAGYDHGLAADDFQITPLSTNVPLPAPALLLGSGLLGLIGWRRRRR